MSVRKRPVSGHLTAPTVAPVTSVTDNLIAEARDLTERLTAARQQLDQAATMAAAGLAFREIERLTERLQELRAAIKREAKRAAKEGRP